MKKLIMLLSAASLAACSTAPQQQAWNDPCSGANNINECHRVAEAGGNVNDYLLYGLAGYTLATMMNAAGQRQTVIIQDPNYHGYRRPIASYNNSRVWVSRQTVVHHYSTPAYSRPAVTRSTTTSTSPGMFGGTSKTVTTTTTQPTYRSSYSTTSYSYSRPSTSSYSTTTTRSTTTSRAAAMRRSK